MPDRFPCPKPRGKYVVHQRPICWQIMQSTYRGSGNPIRPIQDHVYVTQQFGVRHTPPMQSCLGYAVCGGDSWKYHLARSLPFWEALV